MSANNELILKPILQPDPNKLKEAYEVVDDIEATEGSVVVKVPAFFQFDGASIPRFAWQVIGDPFRPRFMRASVFHDWIYHTHQVDKKTADDRFHEMLREDGVGSIKTWIMQKAVTTFGGGYWQNDQGDKDYIVRLAARITASGRNPSDYGIILPVP